MNVAISLFPEVNSEPIQSYFECPGERGFCCHVRQVDAEVNDRLRDLRTHAADDAIRAHQSGGSDRLKQVLGDDRVHGRDTGNVDDGHARVGFDDRFQQRFHQDLRSGAVQRADHRQGEYPVP